MQRHYGSSKRNSLSQGISQAYFPDHASRRRFPPDWRSPVKGLRQIPAPAGREFARSVGNSVTAPCPDANISYRPPSVDLFIDGANFDGRIDIIRLYFVRRHRDALPAVFLCPPPPSVARIERSEIRGRPINMATLSPGFADAQPGLPLAHIQLRRAQ